MPSANRCILVIFCTAASQSAFSRESSCSSESGSRRLGDTVAKNRAMFEAGGGSNTSKWTGILLNHAHFKLYPDCSIFFCPCFPLSLSLSLSRSLLLSLSSPLSLSPSLPLSLSYSLFLLSLPLLSLLLILSLSLPLPLFFPLPASRSPPPAFSTFQPLIRGTIITIPLNC